MMKKNNYILCIILLLTVQLFAQRETANWYFGSNVGLDFNTGNPLLQNNGQLSTTEGCSSVSDSSGDLLFYTNGLEIWNKNHNVMQNGSGLLGSDSGSQSAIVVPNISNPNIYYVFTADVFQAYSNGGSGNGFNYSIIDMSLNGGLGSVISKNINLLSETSEKVTAVSSLNGTGYWVLTHKGNKFYAYKVDGSGVNTPVISTIGMNIIGISNIRGTMKFSPNGEKLAITHSIFEPSFNGFLNIYDFNLNTGIVSNEKQIATDRVFYGVEFSPDSSKLFASGMLVVGSGSSSTTTDIQLYQYDLSFTDIGRTEYLISTLSSQQENHLAGALQLAFNKKIYHSKLDNYLSVINEPNLSRRSIDFGELSIDLNGPLTRYGLPSYEQSAFESIINVENLCFNNATEFNIIINEPIQSINWDFGDPSSGVNNTSTDINPTHLFSSTGQFTITMSVDFVNRATKTYIEFIEIDEPPTFITQVELIQCDINADDGITKFNLTQAESLFGLASDDLIVTYFETLNDALINENLLDEQGYENIINGQIIYAKVFENADCFSIIEVKLTVQPMSNLGAYSSIFVCVDDFSSSLSFDSQEVISLLENDFTGTDVSIYFNETDALLENNSISGNIELQNTDSVAIYFRIESFTACSFIGSLEVGGATLPILEDQTEIFCSNNSNFLDAGEGFWSYLWSTGETTQKIEIESPGNYWVEVSTGVSCSDIMNFEAKLSKEFEISDIRINDFRPQNSVEILLSNYEGNIEYSIDNGLTFYQSNYFNNVTPGIYDVIVRKDNCHSKEQTILVGGYPNFFTPNGDGINDLWKLKKPEYFQEATISIFDRYGKLLKVMTANDGWDGKHEGTLLTASDYWFSIALNEKEVFGHFTLKL